MLGLNARVPSEQMLLLTDYTKNASTSAMTPNAMIVVFVCGLFVDGECASSCTSSWLLMDRRTISSSCATRTDACCAPMSSRPESATWLTPSRSALPSPTSFFTNRMALDGQRSLLLRSSRSVLSRWDPCFNTSAVCEFLLLHPFSLSMGRIGRKT